MLLQVQVPIPSAVGPANIFSRSLICHDVRSSCVYGRGISLVLESAMLLSSLWYPILHSRIV